MILLGDTSGLVAAFNPSDAEHHAARSSLMNASATVVSALVMLEIEHIFTHEHGRQRAYAVNDWILRNTASRRIVLPDLTAASLIQARGVQNAYRDLELDLTDALHVVLSGDFQTNAILTKDHRDFRTTRPLTGHVAFRILPADDE